MGFKKHLTSNYLKEERQIIHFTQPSVVKQDGSFFTEEQQGESSLHLSLSAVFSYNLPCHHPRAVCLPTEFLLSSTRKLSRKVMGGEWVTLLPHALAISWCKSILSQSNLYLPKTGRPPGLCCTNLNVMHNNLLPRQHFLKNQPDGIPRLHASIFTN